MEIIVPSLQDFVLTDVELLIDTLSIEEAEQLFNYFKEASLFKWHNSHNGCEGKADAVCVLLDTWKIPNAKVWAFSGAYLKDHVGALKQNWNYHVGAVIPVLMNEQVMYLVIDPATSDRIQTVDSWAANITEWAHSYYCIRKAHWYIFPPKRISITKWHSRNKQNRKWMLQCLAGINGLNTTGKAKLCFNKAGLKRIASSFEQMKKINPLLAE